MIGCGLLIGLLWLKPGLFHQDRFVIFVLVLTAAVVLGVGVGLDPNGLPSAFTQIGSGMVAGAVVAIVVLVLTRDAH